MRETVGDTAAATVFVAVSQEDAFEVFTQELDQWWRHGRKFRIAGARPGRLVLECRLGGRLFELVELGSGPRSFEVGTVTDWSPPDRVVFEWRNVNFKPHEKTVVEVTFTPSGRGTLVRVEHRGWSQIRDDHPVRHGQLGPAFTRHMGLWWGQLLSGLREFVAAKEAKHL